MASKPPSHLGKQGRALWRSLTENVEYDPDERVVLVNACSLADAIADLEAALQGQPRLVKGSQGQQVINPLITELRQHRQALNATVRQLSYPRAEDSGTALTLSERQSQIARARWGHVNRGKRSA